MGKLGRWYTALAEFDVAKLFQRKRVIGPPRSVFVNQPLPQTDEYFDAKGRPHHKKGVVYTSNQVITSKYTIITFLPRNLLEQFRRVANVFFLGIAILQFFSKFSTISPGLVILPLIIIILITALKDGYEDIKRHQSDRQVNHSKVRVLNGGDPEWYNPNHMQGKERSIGLRIPMPVGKPSKEKKNMDVEQQGRPAVESPVPEPQTPAIEYDSDDEHPHPHPGAHQRRASWFSGHHSPDRAHWKKTWWEDVRVGDFVKIHDNESFPADILICATSEDENVAFVETKNLDGETNLKSRNGVPGLTHLRNARACADERHKFRLDLDKPDTNMYRLNGAVVFNRTSEDDEISADQEKERKVPIDLQMTLLRGTVLRNTKWVIGLVLFTGTDTKIVLNSGGTPSKRSRVERQMNPQVFINLALLGVAATVCAIADSVLEHREYPEGAPWLYADNRSDDNPKINGLITWVFALITFQNIIPISLYLSIEFVRTIQALWIYFDYDIYYAPTDKPTLARSWNLSDDLGQIEYIFSDKTGTLTQNSMVFRECSVGGKVYKGEIVEPSEDSEETQPTAAHKSLNEPVEVRLSDAGNSGNSSNTTPKKEAGQVPDPVEAEGTKLPENVLTRFHNADLSKDLEDAIQAQSSDSNATHARALNGFFTVLSLCHTVLTSVDPETGAIEYKAQSPDEAALVQAAADVGYVFRGRQRETLLLQTPFSDELEKYELLNILEFTSARKRMSVVLRKEDEDGGKGKLFLLTKGADNVVFERLKKGVDEQVKEKTENDLDTFASEGLRTLTLAFKIIPEDEYAAWSERYHEATVAIDGREEMIEKVSDEIEQDLRLLGATAIEDKLQDGVPETIADLKRAGIKIWVATGDKLETAIAIGYTTNLIAKASNIIIIKGGGEDSVPVYEQMVRACEDYFPDTGILEDERVEKSEANLKTTGLRRVATGVSSIVGAGNGERPGGFVLVIDGAALTHALADDQHKYLLLQLTQHCEGVICCRVSPLQKALVVKLVKDGLGSMCLAIGDGANDVSMIQAADVGVGISGEEGLQAVNSSDYAIAQFRFLKKLLLVHGHWSYARNGNMISNFFYKNIVIIGALFWYQIYDGWSSAYMIDYTYLLFWNAFWTIAPVIAIGLFDRIVDADTLMALPELYHYGREGYWFGMKTFLIYMFDGIVQSAILFFIITYSYFSPSARSDGYGVGQFEFATTLSVAAVMVANMYNGLNTNVWTGWVFFAVFLGIVLIWLFTVIYSAVSPGWFVTDVFGNNHFLFHSAYFWLSLPITIFLCLRASFS